MADHAEALDFDLALGLRMLHAETETINSAGQGAAHPLDILLTLLVEKL